MRQSSKNSRGPEHATWLPGRSLAGRGHCSALTSPGPLGRVVLRDRGPGRKFRDEQKVRPADPQPASHKSLKQKTRQRNSHSLWRDRLFPSVLGKSWRVSSLLLPCASHVCLSTARQTCNTHAHTVHVPVCLARGVHGWCLRFKQLLYWHDSYKVISTHFSRLLQPTEKPAHLVSKETPGPVTLAMRSPCHPVQCLGVAAPHLVDTRIVTLQILIGTLTAQRFSIGLFLVIPEIENIYCL